MGILKKNKNNGGETDTKDRTEEKEQADTKELTVKDADRQKKRPLRIVVPVLLLAVCAAGVCYVFYAYPQMKEKVPAMADTVFQKEGTQETGDNQESKGPQEVKNDLTADETGNLQTQTQETPEDAQTAEQSQEERSAADPVGAADGQETPGNSAAASDNEDSADILAGLNILGDKADGNGADSMTETADKGESLEILPAQPDEETVCGADGPLLDYADENVLVFHDYYGLFVYDWQKAEMTGTIDLEAIGCQYTQGDSFCDVIVEAGAETIYLHPLDSDGMYVYQTEAQTLTKTRFTQSVLPKRPEMKLTEETTMHDPTVFRSVKCAVLEDGGCLYLESGSGMAADLFYVVEEDGERKRTGYLFGLQTAADALGTEESSDDIPDKEAVTVSDYSEEAFRELCRQIDYRKLMREQETYLNCAVTVELTVLEQIDGGLFDDNIYYLCAAQDSRGFERYYVVRDDRGEDAALILEGDVMQVYGLFFDTCGCPAGYTEVRQEIPAIAMAYCELREEF